MNRIQRFVMWLFRIRLLEPGAQPVYVPLTEVVNGYVLSESDYWKLTKQLITADVEYGIFCDTEFKYRELEKKASGYFARRKKIAEFAVAKKQRIDRQIKVAVAIEMARTYLKTAAKK